MLLVLVIAAAIWGLGRLMGASRQARLYMLGLLYVALLALHLVLPDGHPLRMATGESPALWAILGGFVALALAYAQVLRRVKARASLIPSRDGSFTRHSEVNPGQFRSDRVKPAPE